jgi:hypothetical protein
MYHPSGFTQDNTLVELFNAITEETSSHQGDQTAFTLLYEYIMFSIAFYIISSKVYNDYLYTYIMQTNFEYDQAWDGMRNEFDDDPNRVIIEASEIAASEEAEWSRYVLSYQISKSLCMPAYIVARFITYARRELLAVKDTTGATSGSGIIFFDIANASGRSVLDEDPNTTITSLTNNINNVASGLSNALGRIATVVSSDLSTIALSINTMLFWFDYLAQQFGLTFPVYDPGNDQSGAPGDNIFVTIESLRAQLETIYTTLRLNRS